MSRPRSMRWPNPEDELLVTCVRAGFGQAERARVVEICRGNGIRWERVFATARLHGVAPLVYRNLVRIDPADLGVVNGALDRFRRRFGENLMIKQQHRERLWDLLAFFNAHRLDVMLIKGAGMDLFGNGSGRYAESQDVDLIVRAHSEDLSEQLLSKLRGLSRRFPLEYDFYGHHDLDLNGALLIDWDQVWADSVPVRYVGRDFLIMSPEDALIAACINASRKRYFNLKALCAIDSQLRHRKALEWDRLVEKARAYQVTGIAYAALVVADKVMSSPMPSDVAAMLGVAGLRAAALDLLTSRRSFSSFGTMYSGLELAGRRVNSSLLLPYATYRGDQILRKLRYAVST